MESTYKWDNIKEVESRSTKLSSNQRKLILGLLNEFEDLFDSVQGKWDTKTFYIEQKID